MTAVPMATARHRGDEMARQYTARLNLVEENGDLVMYCEIKESRRDSFKRIARRCSGENWVSLEPGYAVRGSTPGTDYKTITIEYNPTSAVVQ
jgi:hypothetical protein